MAQFPNIAPPEIRVWALYPGADAETMERAVATPMEQQINGVDNMDYMYSLNSTNNSSTALLVNFDLKTDPNMDLLLTQSRQQLANGQLPPEVNQIGIDVKKSLTSPMMLIAVYSPKGTHDAKFLSNYAYINLTDPIARSYGVGLTQVYGIGQYAMRLWVKPDRLAKLGVTVSEVVNAVQAQNTVNPAGQVGGEPSVAGQQFTYTVRAQGRLKTPEEFGDIIVREGADGGLVRVRDVATVDLGSQDYGWQARLNGEPVAEIGIYQLPGSNAVEAAKGIRKLMAKMKERFPADVDYAITLDTTDAVRAGMQEIVMTLVIAFVLVILVVYLFLQDWRATLIPMLAVPVSLVATFAVFPFFGFSVNTLSLFGLVLAIGLVVDDAIVVVEGIQRHIEEGLQKLSLGNQQRVQLAAALVFGPDLLVLDEPFAGLDPVAVDVMSAVLREQAEAGVPVVFSSHELDLVERVCDRVGIIERGHMIAIGTVRELRRGGPERLWIDAPLAPPDWVAAAPGATVVRTEGTRTLLELAPGSDDQAVLQAALRTGPVREFRPAEASLGELFRGAIEEADS